MDSNNPTVAPNPAPQPSPQQPPTQTPVAAPPAGDSKKMVLWLIVGFVVVIALVAGIYFLMSSRQQAATEEQPAAITQIQTPMPAVEENLEEDLNSISVETALDSEFSSVDQDLQGL
ncbi:hypothetical protein HYU93_03605 [Candidatus Daviesbacteria bacterium]|nr:hypothetical protein [Candidatus Daviesbacteria bacterium]